MGHSADNSSVNEQYSNQQNMGQEVYTPSRLKSISFDGDVPPIVEPTNKEEFTRRQSVVAKDFMSSGTGSFVIECMSLNQLLPVDPPGPGLCALLLSLLSLLLVAVTLPISLCLCIKVIGQTLSEINLAIILIETFYFLYR